MINKLQKRSNNCKSKKLFKLDHSLQLFTINEKQSYDTNKPLTVVVSIVGIERKDFSNDWATQLEGILYPLDLNKKLYT